MKKSRFLRFIPLIAAILLFSFAIIYVRIYGMNNDDVVNRTVNFWIPTCFLALASAVFCGDTFVDTIKERDWLKVAMLILQGVIVVAAAVYCYIITIQVIQINQQIECLPSDNYKNSSQLFHIRLDLISKRDWTICVALWIAYLLKGCPYLVRKITNWVQDNKKSGKDQ